MHSESNFTLTTKDDKRTLFSSHRKTDKYFVLFAKDESLECVHPYIYNTPDKT